MTFTLSVSECEAATCARLGVSIDIDDEKHVLTTAGVSHAEQSPFSQNAIRDSDQENSNFFLAAASSSLRFG